APIATAFHTATRLSATDVLIIGGYSVVGTVAVDANAAAPVQLLSVAGGMINVTQSAPGALLAVGYHQTTPLSDLPAPLVPGGSPLDVGTAQMMPCGLHCAVPNAYLLDRATRDVVDLPELRLQTARYGHRQTELFDGTVLVTGGLRYAPEMHDDKTRVL